MPFVVCSPQVDIVASSTVAQEEKYRTRNSARVTAFQIKVSILHSSRLISSHLIPSYLRQRLRPAKPSQLDKPTPARPRNIPNELMSKRAGWGGASYQRQRVLFTLPRLSTTMLCPTLHVSLLSCCATPEHTPPTKKNPMGRTKDMSPNSPPSPPKTPKKKLNPLSQPPSP